MTVRKHIELNSRCLDAIREFNMVIAEAQQLSSAAQDALKQVIQEEYQVDITDGTTRLDTHYFEDCGTAFLCPQSASPAGLLSRTLIPRKEGLH